MSSWIRTDGRPAGRRRRRVESPDVEAEHARVAAIEGVSTGEMVGVEGPVPRMFSIEDPDGNHIWVVQSR
jgi:predicted enzyme related to lactoylglutathione lyase